MASFAAVFSATAAFGLAACAAFLDGQGKGPRDLSGASGIETVDEERGEPLAGGYAAGDMQDEGAKKALQIATDAIYERFPTRALVDAVSLETQVVAGLNYRYRIEMGGSPDARAIFEAIVYRDLDDNYELNRLTKLQ